MKKLFLLGLLITFVIPGANVAAQEDTAIASYIADATDLHGCWKRLVFSPDNMEKMNQIEPWPEKFQWFCFFENEDFGSIQATGDLLTSEAELREALKTNLLRSSSTFEVPQKGVVAIENANADRKNYWVTSRFNKKAAILGRQIEAGDLLMTLQNSDQEIIYYRYLISMGSDQQDRNIEDQQATMHFLNLIRENWGVEFCSPEGTTILDIATELESHEKAYPNKAVLTDEETLRSLKAMYPCS